MTPDLIELSKQAAEVLGIEPHRAPYGFNLVRLWLAEDSGRCADIAADRRIGVNYSNDNRVFVFWTEGRTPKEASAALADHNDDRKQAWRVAVLKAVVEQERENI